MKARVILYLLFLGVVGYAQRQNEIKEVVVASGEVSLAFFDSDIAISLKIAHDTIQELSFGELPSERNQIIGIFPMENLSNSLELNTLKFNDSKVNEVLKIFVSPHFESRNGGLIFLYIFEKESRGSVIVLDITKEQDASYRVDYLDFDKEKLKRYPIDWIDIRLDFSLNIKKCLIKTKDNEKIIFPQKRRN